MVELKKDAFPKKILNQLYKLTPLQTSFSLNMVWLDERGQQPRLNNLKDLLLSFVNHRKEVVENFEKSNVEFFIKETYENSGLNKFKDDSIYKFDKDIVLSDKLEDQAVLPELKRNVYLTGFPNDIIEELAKNKLKLNN